MKRDCKNNILSIMAVRQESDECDNSKGTGHRHVVELYVVELYGDLALDKQHLMSL